MNETNVSIIRLDEVIDYFDIKLDENGNMVYASPILEEKFREAGWCKEESWFNGNVVLVHLTQELKDFATPNRQTGWFAKNDNNGTSFLGLEIEAYNIPSKNTFYDNVAFRSRTEAKLAVAFDAWGWRWEYEPERFTAFGGESYLPDFYLPDFDVYVEVKGTDEQLFASQSKISGAIDFNATPASKGLLLMGPLPYDSGRTSYFKLEGSYLYCDEGVCLDHFYITCNKNRVFLILRNECCDCSSWPDLPSASSVNIKIVNDFNYPDCARLHNGLYYARLARFDFDDSLQKALSENRKVIGGNL